MLFALILAAYTNHAGLAVCAIPVRLEAHHVTLSNETETVRVPLSIFPPSECRRIAADCGSTRFVPQEVRQALKGHDERLRRAYARRARDLITQEEYEAYRKQSDATRRAYLEKAVESGRITPQERRLL